MSDTAETTVAETAELVKSVINMLNEEKWTRAALSNYSEHQFRELDDLLRQVREEKLEGETKKVCDAHLSHTRNSIIALYLSGMLALSRQIIDDGALSTLVTIFVDNHKWTIVRFLCERILDYGESKFALRTLADCCRNDNEEEKLIGIYERIVKADFEEADLARLLAENAEKNGDISGAVDYYKKAMYRYVGKQLFTNVREIWLKLLEYCPEETDFFLHAEKRIARGISEDRAILLLKDLCASCRSRGAIDTAIAILKMILKYDERDSKARAEIVECFREKYAEHSQLEEYVRISNLSQGYRNVHEAIQDFEKHIAFDRGNYVYHRTWGVGRIASIQGDTIVIDFSKQRNHQMSLKMAVDALQTLAKDHIWVLKAIWKKEKLHDKTKNEVEWALKTVIRSFGNSCDIKRIKAELVPSVLGAGEWTAWSTKAREVLKTDPSLGVSPENIDRYVVRDHPVSREEKLSGEFRAERGFFDRIQIIRSFVSEKSFEPDSELFAEMLVWLQGFLRAASPAGEQVISAYLVLKEISGRFPQISPPQMDFAGLFAEIKDVREIFMSIRDAKIREEFLRHVKLLVPGWAGIFITLFPGVLSPSIIADLEKEKMENLLSAMVRRVFDNCREYRETVVWLFRNSREKSWFAAAGLGEEKILVTLIQVLDYTFRDIENHRDVTENRKINRQAHSVLFRDGELESYAASHDSGAARRIFSYVNDVKDLDPADKIKFRNRVLELHPDVKFAQDTEKAATTRGFTATLEKYREKEKQLGHIMDTEIPQNSKDIAFALSLGDLRENAEYKAAKEKQEILNSQVAKLKDELGRAQLFDPATATASRVSFGTVTVLLNGLSGNEETYTVLGPWESDPDNRIISYLSPFGAAMLNKKEGEEFSFSVNGEKITYTVRGITTASF